MKIALIVALAVLQAPSALAAAAAAKTPLLIWEQAYAGSAAGFDWAHGVALDATDSMVYAVGRSSEVYGGQSYGANWAQGYAVANGQRAWTVDLSTFSLGGTGGNYSTTVSEEMGVSFQRWGNNNILYAGRFPGTAGSRLWTGSRRIETPAGATQASSNIAGAARTSGFSPPVRGIGTALLDPAVGGWVFGYQNSATNESLGYAAVDYGFTKFTTSANAGTTYAFNPLSVNSNWAGDCCYDPAYRMSADSSGNLYALGGSIYDATTGSYGFLMLKLKTSGGGAGTMTTWTYEGTAANGRSVADALVAAADGSQVFVLAKTSETGRGFASRLMAFDGNGNLQWLKDLSTDSGPMLDAAVAMSPLGTLRVVESRTGKVLTFDSSGNGTGTPLQLPLAAGSTYYIGSAATDDNGNLFVSGSKNDEAWVADYNNLVSPSAPSCGIVAAYNYPNPFDSRSGATTIHYELFADSNAKLTIYDQVGAEVREWSFGQGSAGGSAGTNEFAWDGTTSSGRKVVTGMYLARLSASSPSSCESIFRIGVKH